jgi:DNA-binding GntR family transcriptional regulator
MVYQVLPDSAWQRLSSVVSMEEIDHHAGEPVWSQLVGILRGQIERGAIPTGKLLPSISSLMQIYGVSDGTVKRALRALRDEGLVSTVPGRGSYVSK